jgi:hypothetical protein
MLREEACYLRCLDEDMLMSREKNANLEGVRDESSSNDICSAALFKVRERDKTGETSALFSKFPSTRDILRGFGCRAQFAVSV